MVKHIRFVFFALSLSAQLAGQVKPIQYMESLVYPYPVQRIQLPENREIAYVEEGKGPYTLVMVHGLGSYLPVYTKLINELQGDYRCIALDLPNYGKSGRGDYAFSMSFFAETLDAFIKELKLEKVILVGHSMGSQVALTLALKKPAYLKGMVLLAPAGIETFTAEQKSWYASVMTPQLVKATPVAQIERNFEVNFHGNKLPEDARFMLEDRLRMRADTQEYDRYCQMIPKCVMGMLNEPVFDRLPDLDVPALIVFGEEDGLIPNRLLHPGLTTRQVAELGRERIRGSVLKMLSPCGHFVPWECPEGIALAVREFTPGLKRKN